MDEAATVGEVIAIPLDVRETQTHLSGGQGRDVLGGRKALASPSVSLQDVLLVLEGAHLVDDGRLVDTTLYFGEEPAGVVLELGVRVAEEGVLEPSPREETVFQDGVDVAKEEPRVLVEVIALVEVVLDKAQPDKLDMVLFVLPQDLVRLLLSGHRVVKESWSDQDSSLPHEVSVTLNSSELILSGLVLTDLGEQVAQFTV